MTSLVLELQRDAMDSSLAVSAVLRKALAVAAKLDLPEFRQLCEKELGGYGLDDEVPDYRNLRGLELELPRSR